MEKILVFGHKSPDTDSIMSSIAMANLLQKQGKEAKAFRLGNINKETEYALNYFNIPAPELLNKVSENDKLILVDHNEFTQSVDGIETANIEMVVDHHRICNFQTTNPLTYIALPVGCSSTILYQLYSISNINIDEKIAGLMLSAIISDTLLFKSPTCTKKDIDAAKALANIANIDLETYGLDMLKAGTDLSSFTAEEIIDLDAKEFNVGDTKIEISQVNTASIDDVLKMQDALESAMKNTIKNKNLNLFMLAITDIINSNSKVLVLGDRTDIVEKGYNVKLENNTALLKGVVSRKKQMVPIITKNV